MKPESAHHFPTPSIFFSGQTEKMQELQISFFAEHETSIKHLDCYFKLGLENTLLSALDKNMKIEAINFVTDVPEMVIRKITDLYKLKRVRFDDKCSLDCHSEEWRLFWEKQKDSLEEYIRWEDKPSKCSAHNSYNCFPAAWFGLSLKENKSFLKLKSLMIDGEQMRYLIKAVKLGKKTFPSLTKLKLDCQSDQPTCSLLSSLDEIRLSVFPELAHAIITIYGECFTLELAEILGKFRNVIKELSISGVPREEPIQHINNPHLVLPNLTYLDMGAPNITMSYESFMDIFKNCPKLKNVRIHLHNISGFDQNQFIEELNKKQIGQAIQKFSLSVFYNFKLGDLKMVEAMIRNWPNLKNIEHPIWWCQIPDLHSCKAFEEFAKNYGMEVEIVKDCEDWANDWEDENSDYSDDN